MSILNSPAALVERWKLQGSGAASLGRYPGTPANMAGWPASFLKNNLTCGEMNGNNSNINVGDVVELNAVSAFTICFWMAQDVLDQRDIIWSKGTGTTNVLNMYTWNDGTLTLRLAAGAEKFGRVADYSTVIGAGTWHHLAEVFDGAQTGDASRLQLYVDGAPVALAFAGPIPAATADLAGQDMILGAATTAFDGRLFDFRVYNRALSRDQVNTIIHEPLALI